MYQMELAMKVYWQFETHGRKYLRTTNEANGAPKDFNYEEL